MSDKGESPKPQKKWLQLIIIIVEVAVFLSAWALLILGIFNGYFAIFLIIISGLVIFFSIRDRSEED